MKTKVLEIIKRSQIILKMSTRNLMQIVCIPLGFEVVNTQEKLDINFHRKFCH